MTDVKEQVRTVLATMFEGWRLHEGSWDPVEERYRLSMEEAMTEACDGDAVSGQVLATFGHWSNDLQDLAAHYGMEMGPNMERVEVPPAPSPLHWWHDGVWREPEGQPNTVDERPESV